MEYDEREYLTESMYIHEKMLEEEWELYEYERRKSVTVELGIYGRRKKKNHSSRWPFSKNKSVSVTGAAKAKTDNRSSVYTGVSLQ